MLSGGDPLLAFRYIKSNGLASADNYPYTAHQGRCKQQSDTKLAISSASREILNGNENRLKQFVANYGPVAVAINAAKSFSNYRSGIYTNSKCSKDLNHAMLLVGYGYDSKTKLDYWLVKNSWVGDEKKNFLCVLKAESHGFKTMIKVVLLGNVMGRERICANGSKQRINLWNRF